MTSAQEAAEQAAEAIRQANHLTFPGRATLENPGDVYAVIGDLLAMTQRLPQLLGQLSDWLAAEHEAGRVGDDRPIDPGLRTFGVRHHLKTASALLGGPVESALNSAHAACSHLTGLDPAESETRP